jgi:hypothetical protein
VPQFAGSARTSRQTPPQQRDPDGHACPQAAQSASVPSVVQTPPQHAWPDAQARPQPPQLKTSSQTSQNRGRGTCMRLVMKLGGRRIRSPSAATAGARRPLLPRPRRAVALATRPTGTARGGRHRDGAATVHHTHIPFASIRVEPGGQQPVPPPGTETMTSDGSQSPVAQFQTGVVGFAARHCAHRFVVPGGGQPTPLKAQSSSAGVAQPSPAAQHLNPAGQHFRPGWVVHGWRIDGHWHCDTPPAPRTQTCPPVHASPQWWQSASVPSGVGCRGQPTPLGVGGQQPNPAGTGSLQSWQSVTVPSSRHVPLQHFSNGWRHGLLHLPQCRLSVSGSTHSLSHRILPSGQSQSHVAGSWIWPSPRQPAQHMHADVSRVPIGHSRRQFPRHPISRGPQQMPVASGVPYQSGTQRNPGAQKSSCEPGLQYQPCWFPIHCRLAIVPVASLLIVAGVGTACTIRGGGRRQSKVCDKELVRNGNSSVTSTVQW